MNSAPVRWQGHAGEDRTNLHCAQLQASEAANPRSQSAVAAFAANRLCLGTPRSDAYRAGYCAQLLWFANGSPKGVGAGHPPYAIGTSDADAWMAGSDAAASPLSRVDWATSLKVQPNVSETL